MQSHDLEAFLSVNEQLASLVRLGVRFDLGLGDHPDDVEQRLQRMSADVARKVSQGATLERTLADMQSGDFAKYAAAMRWALACGDWTAPLEHSRAVAQSNREAWRSVWSGMAYPLLVCVLAYAGMVVFCVYLTPSLQSLYSQLHLPLGRWSGALVWLRSNLWWWAWIPPLLVAAILLWLRWRARGRIVSGSSVRWSRRAELADMLGDLVGDQVPSQQAIRMAKAAAAGDVGRPHLHSMRRALERNVGTAVRHPLSPLLRWTMGESDQGPQQALLLHAAADAYRSQCVNQAERRDRRVTIIPCVLIGGGAALLYGLALFLPLVELLIALATETVSTALHS